MAININRDRNNTRQRTRTVFVPVNVGGGGGTREKIKVGEMGIKLSNSTFTEVPDIFDFSDVTDFGSMFQACYNLTSIPEIDTSKATDMWGMFEQCESLKNIPQLDTTNVRSMFRMFQGCTGLDERLHLKLNTPNHTYVSYLYAGTPESKVNDAFQINPGYGDIAAAQALWNEKTWDFSNVTTTERMFEDCPNISFAFFHNLKASLDISYLTELTPTYEIPYPFASFVSSLYFGVHDFLSAGETPTSQQGVISISQEAKTQIMEATGGEDGFNQQIVAMFMSKGWTLTV